MHTPFRYLLATMTLALFHMLPAYAQQPPGPRLFNPATIETAVGVVARVDSVQGPRGRAVGIHVQLQTGADTLAVHLGPAWYLADQSWAPQVGDTLTVRGSRVTVRGAPALIAMQVQGTPPPVRLRDAQGRPLWRSLRRR